MTTLSVEPGIAQPRGSVANFATGQQATTAAAVALPAQKASTVTIKALKASSESVYIGLAGVTIATGFELAAGDQPVTIAVADVSEIHIIGAAGGGKCSWVANY